MAGEGVLLGMTGRLKREIKQTRQFTIHEEVVLAMLRTADLLAAPMNEVLRDHNLSLSQYNVLRILRGAPADGLACGDVSERMIRRDPDLTRLLDRLETRGLVARSRGSKDRRVVTATITEEGRALLDALDKTVDAAIRKTLAHMPESRIEQLIDLLEEARAEK